MSTTVGEPPISGFYRLRRLALKRTPWMQLPRWSTHTRPGRRGFTQQPEISKRAHLSVPALQTPPKFHEKTPREREERMKFPVGESKKNPPFGPHPPGPQQKQLAKCGLAKFGQQKLAKFGQMRSQMRPVEIGQMWFWPNSVWPHAAKLRMAKSGLAKCGHG